MIIERNIKIFRRNYTRTLIVAFVSLSVLKRKHYDFQLVIEIIKEKEEKASYSVIFFFFCPKTDYLYLKSNCKSCLVIRIF